MSIFNKKFLNEVYKSKYSSYLEEDDDDDEEEKSDDKKKNNPPKEVHHLSMSDIRRVMNLVTSSLGKYPKLKKCCDYIDLYDRDHINDDGERESSFGAYSKGSPNARLKLMDGDVFSGYPDFRNGGNEEYEKDVDAFVKDVNKLIAEKDIKAKFSAGNKDDEAIDFGIKSLS